MPKFQSDEFFNELVAALSADPKWTESTKGIKTSMLFNVTDTGSSHLLTVDQGVTSVQTAPQGATAEFSFEGTYDAWTKVAKGEVDIQSAVLKGQLKFKGSITKILMYRDRFMLIADLMKNVQKEY
ncbi:MAG: SCP2 sterol-binding domain-containing protein [Nitrososphaerales archaeon]|nr:SCP2 sterol-binding domain-containing protein [Nitrososphaerales archaeon]